MKDKLLLKQRRQIKRDIIKAKIMKLYDNIGPAGWLIIGYIGVLAAILIFALFIR